MGKSVKNMVIDAEVVSREERVVSPARTSPESVSARPQPQTVAAPARGRASAKAKGKRGRARQTQELAFGGLRIQMPEPRLRCPVCQAPATLDRQVSIGPLHTYLCPDCGDVASGAMQVVNFFKMMK